MKTVSLESIFLEGHFLTVEQEMSNVRVHVDRWKIVSNRNPANSPELLARHVGFGLSDRIRPFSWGSEV